MAESKRDRFVRIVETRTNKILDMLRLLANCANKSNYDYDDDDIKQRGQGNKERFFRY